jgi:hypothetical protein
MHSDDLANRLCLSCGLCCNGVLFRDVELRAPGESRHLAAWGLPVKLPRSAAVPARLPQPCAALCADHRCRIYAERPARCREFQCGVLQRLLAGQLEPAAAQQLIRRTREQAQRVRDLLRELGDTAEHLPLSVRFRRMRRRIEAGGAATEAVELFGELTLAAHQLNVLTHQHFYTKPDAPPPA